MPYDKIHTFHYEINYFSWSPLEGFDPIFTKLTRSNDIGSHILTLILHLHQMWGCYN